MVNLVLSRPKVRLFQYHRFEKSWNWSKETDTEYDFSISGRPDETVQENVEIGICFEISQVVHNDDICVLEGDINHTIRLSIPNPDPLWLDEERQLLEITKKIHSIYYSCLRIFPNVSKWHLFCAVPAPVAVSIGQQINPTMFPPIQLYEFVKTREKSYSPSLLLKGDSIG